MQYASVCLCHLLHHAAISLVILACKERSLRLSPFDIWPLKYEPKSRLVTHASQAHVTRVECNLHFALSAATCYFSVGKVITLGHLVIK